MVGINSRRVNSRGNIFAREQEAKEERARVLRARQVPEQKTFFSPQGVAARANLGRTSRAMNFANSRGLDLRTAMERISNGNKHFREALDATKEQFQSHIHNLSAEEKQYREYLAKVKESMEVQEQEQLVYQLQSVKMEREELVHQQKMVGQLARLLEEKKIPRAQAVLIAKEMVVALRGLLHQQALSAENYEKVIKNEHILLQIATASANQMGSKEITQAMRSGGLSRTDLVAEVVQNVLTQNKLIEEQ